MSRASLLGFPSYARWPCFVIDGEDRAEAIETMPGADRKLSASNFMYMALREWAVEKGFRRFDFGRVFLGNIAHRLHVFVAEQRVSIEAHLGVEHEQLAEYVNGCILAMGGDLPSSPEPPSAETAPMEESPVEDAVPVDPMEAEVVMEQSDGAQ